jgi:hypothetical protein
MDGRCRQHASVAVINRLSRRPQQWTSEQARIAGRKGGRHAKPRKGWRTVTCNLPPQDYATLAAVVERDRTRFATLVREAVQTYIHEVLIMVPSRRAPSEAKS